MAEHQKDNKLIKPERDESVAINFIRSQVNEIIKIIHGLPELYQKFNVLLSYLDIEFIKDERDIIDTYDFYSEGNRKIHEEELQTRLLRLEETVLELKRYFYNT